jgi:chaperonin GroEL
MYNTPKEIVLSDAARTKLMSGISKLASAVKVTLGPKGRNVIIQQAINPMITKDGVTVARAVTLKDPIENMGNMLVRQAAAKTAVQAGDGTTTATILAEEIIKRGHKLIVSGAAPTPLNKGIQKMSELILDNLNKLALRVDNDWERISQVASVSANNDEFIGEIIKEAYKKVTIDGVIAVEESKTSDTYIEEVNGMEFDRGYLSPYFVTELKNMTCEYDDVLVLLVDGKIKNSKHIIPILDKVAASNKALLLLAEDIDPQTLSLLVINKVRAGLKLVAVKSPSFGERKKAMLTDIAILTGATIINDTTGTTLDKVALSHFGKCKKIKVTSKSCAIIDGQGDKEKVLERVEQIKSQISSEDTSWGENQIKERIAKLLGGVAIIKVGAATEVEMREKKDRIDDSLHATRAALIEGIVPGGGVALIKAIKDIDLTQFKEQDERAGAELLIQAVTSPIKVICDNAGVSGEVVLDKVFSSDGNIGYNAKTDKFENLLETGVIDPVFVTKTALINAVSVAKMVLSTECAISVLEQDKGGYQEESEYDPDLITV